MQVPGGAIGDLLRSYGPKREAYANRAGLNLESWSRFKATKHWEIIRSHLIIGKSRYIFENPEMKWFLQVIIAHFAAFCLRICGGSIWKSIAYLFIDYFK